LPVTRLEDLALSIPDAESLHLNAIEQRAHNCTIFELVALGVLTRLVKPRLAFEIGTYDGRGTLAIAINAPDAEVITLNLPPDYLERTPGACANPDVHLSVEVASGERFLANPAAERITQVYGNSQTFDFSPYRGSQFVFIDGGHDGETAMRDSRSALDIVDRDNGLVVWHDATSFGVRGVTAQLHREGLPLRLIAGTDIAVLRWRRGHSVAEYFGA
jgi:predicted O-methyltransferase YrrM